MNSRQRMAAAMQHGLPDRVPVMCQLALGHYFLNTDLSPQEIWFTSEGFAEALVTLQRRYRFDGILINLPGRPPGLLDRIQSIQKNDDGQWITWDTGDRTFFPWDDNPHFHVADPDVPSRADFAKLDPDDLSGLDGFKGYLWNTYHIPWLDGKEQPGPLAEIPPYFFDTIDAVKRRVGDEVSVHGEVFSPLTHYLELFGYEKALVTFIMNKKKVHAILDRITEAAITWAVAQAKHGVDAVLMSSAFVGGPFLSPRMYKEFVVPYERRVAEAVKATGVPIYTHTCGSIGDRLDLMIETGIQGIDTFDPPPLGNTELATVKAQIGDKIFIKGNMNSVELLQAKHEQEVIDMATDRIVTGMPGGGYILSTACSVAPKVAPWKLEMLTTLAEELGQYR